VTFTFQCTTRAQEHRAAAWHKTPDFTPCRHAASQ